MNTIIVPSKFLSLLSSLYSSTSNQISFKLYFFQILRPAVFYNHLLSHLQNCETSRYYPLQLRITRYTIYHRFFFLIFLFLWYTIPTQIKGHSIFIVCQIIRIMVVVFQCTVIQSSILASAAVSKLQKP